MTIIPSAPVSRLPRRLLWPAGLTLCLAAAVALLHATGARADDDPPKKLVIGTKVAPPFSMKTETGEWQGISIDIWNGVAAELGVETEFKEVPLEELIDGVAAGRLDAAIAALTVTPERETKVDFTHSYFSSGLGIAIGVRDRSMWRTIVSRLVSREFLAVFGTLLAVLLAAGLLLWIFERRRNAAQFGPGTRGIGAAMWWSAVTMTTVGYGDKAPITLGGRIVAFFWMFASLLLVATFTAAITTALTVSELEASVHGPEDLPGLRVGTVPDSTSARYLASHGVGTIHYENAESALRALARGQLDAVVYDQPLLAYLASHAEGLKGKVEVLPRTFDRQDYAIALREGSPMREAMNRVLLRIISSELFDELKSRYE